MDWISLSTASRELGVAHDTLRAQVHRGKLAATKIGRDWLITRDELAEGQGFLDRLLDWARNGDR